MSDDEEATDALLAPLEASLRERARVEAGERVATAERLAQQRLADARAEADRIAGDARQAGIADATAKVAIERIESDRRARAVLARARAAAYEQLRARSRDAVRALPADPDGRVLVANLAVAARRELGAHATVIAQPDGGVVAHEGSRRILATLDGVADQALRSLGAEIAGLWAP